MSELRLQPRVLGIDLGQVRVGVAISDELGLLAHPLDTIPRGVAASLIAQIARERKVSAIIVGVPRHMSGDSGESANDALAFVDQLRRLAACHVLTIDERLSTVAANRALRDAGRKAHETRGYVDQVAAQMILQTYLDQQQQRG